VKSSGGTMSVPVKKGDAIAESHFTKQIVRVL